MHLSDEIHCQTDSDVAKKKLAKVSVSDVETSVVAVVPPPHFRRRRPQRQDSRAAAST